MPPFRRWEWFALAGILLLAAALRLGAPGITEFKRDEANLSQLSLNLVHGREFPLLGITSSVGVPNPPLNVYLFAIPYALDDSPMLATLFVGVMNVIAVALTWMLARRYYGYSAALVAALLYAVSPWAVIYSRKIWAQDLLPPFIVATVFSGLLGYGEGKRWARWNHWPLLAITVQLHYGAFTLIPLSLLMMALGFRCWSRRELIVLLALVVLTGIPVLFGVVQSDLLNRETLEKALNGEDHTQQISTTALDYAWFTVAGTNIHSLAGAEQFRNYLDSVPDVYWLFKLIPLSAVLTALWLTWRNARNRNRQFSDIVLLVWFVLPILAFTWEWTDVAPHYFIPLMPAAYILSGIGFVRLVRLAKTGTLDRVVLAGSTALLIVIAGMQVYLFAHLLRFLDKHDTPGGFGTPLHMLLDIRSDVLEHQPEEVIMVSDEELAPYDQEPAVWGALLDDVPQIRFVDGTQTVVVPQGTSLELVRWTPDLKVPAIGGEQFDLRDGSTSFYLLRESISVPDASFVQINPIRFANGAYLSMYAIRPDGLWLAWTLSQPADRDYQVFVHALDANGQRLAQQDRASWPGRYWRAGDTLYCWFEMPVPTETTTLYAGMYTVDGETFDNIEVLDEQGAYLAQGAEIRLEKN